MKEWWAKLRSVFRRDALARDLGDEIEAHLQMEADANRDRGMDRDAALAHARRRFGNQTRIHESSRETWTFTAIETLGRDVRYGLRILRRAPGFTATAIVVIALGVGATTAAFTLLDHVLLRRLPFAEPDRLVTLYESQPLNGVPRTQTSPPNLLDWRSMNNSFEAMGGYMSVTFPLNLSGKGEPLRLDSYLVDVNVLPTLGVEPAAGRIFTEDDGRVDGESVVILSHGLATSLFGSAAGAVGQSVSLDNQAIAIVGVMPASFAFPSRDAHLWRPLRYSPQLLALRSNHIVYAVARLRPGVSMEQARADMDVVGKQLQRAYPKDNARTEIAVATLRSTMLPQSRMLVIGIFAAAFCLMLIACTNLANLLFARSIARRQEMAVRTAIGAGRERLLRQLLTESLVLAGIGGAIGLALARIVTPLTARLVPASLPVGAIPEMDWRMFGFAAVLTLATSVAFGVGPALQSGRAGIINMRRTRSTDRHGGRWRELLVFIEVAATVTLLVGAGLLVKALWRVQDRDPGFRSDGVVTARTALPVPKYADAAARRDFYERVLTSVRQLPHVEAAAYVSYHPMERASGRLAVTSPGVAEDPLSAPQAIIHFVTPGFFDALRIPLLRGRDVSDRDQAGGQLVAVIGASLAERLWPGQDPIGRVVRVMRAERTVVGVAGNIAVRTLELAADPQIYFPAEQLPPGSAYYAPKDLIVRADGDAALLMPALRSIVRDADPDQALSNLRLLDDVLADQTAPRRDQLVVLGSVTLIAVLLVVVGIHGLLAFTVSMRAQEIGVRVALGASRGTILAMFLRRGLWLALGGVLLAVPAAYAAARGMSALLFGVDPADPPTYGLAALIALALTLAGSVRPAVRAATIDPAVTLKSE